MSTAAEIPDSVMEDAIGWFDDLRASGNADRQGFATWLMRSPTHIEAFLSVATLHGGLSAARADNRAWLQSLLEEAHSNVLPLNEHGTRLPQTSATTSWPSARRRRWRWAGLAAALLVAVTMTLVNSPWPFDRSNQPQQYVTTLGEQRAIVLDDGSVMQLNTDSAVTVQFNAEARKIELTRGEAMFDVRKDPLRPFRVHSGDVTVQAIGTRFNVYQHHDGTVVTVIEGQVKVEPTELDPAGASVSSAPKPESTTNTGTLNGIGATVQLDAGEQLAIRSDGAVADIPIPVDTQRTTAWTQRRVVFDDDTLATVIAEFNRYNRIKLVIRDAVLSQRRISGIFTVDDPKAFAEVLASMAPVQSVEHADGSLEIVNAAATIFPIHQ